MLEQIQTNLNAIQGFWKYEVFLMIIVVMLMAIGVGRLRSSFGKRWIAIFFCLLSYCFAMGITIGHVWVYKLTTMSYLQVKNFPEVGAICKDWGSNFNSQKRSEYSEMIAREVFVHSGKLRDYFDVNGKLVEFRPCDKDRQERTNLMATLDQMEKIPDRVLWFVVLWTIVPLIGIASGFIAIRFYRRMK